MPAHFFTEKRLLHIYLPKNDMETRTLLLIVSSIPLLISIREDGTGVLARCLVLIIHLEYGSLRFAAMMLVFVFTTWLLSLFRISMKEQVYADLPEVGQENGLQAFSSIGIAAALCLVIGNLTGWEDKCLDSKESVLVTFLIGGMIGHYSCCTGDAWSLEIGIHRDDGPRLITTLMRVPKGTHGAVTTRGLLAAFVAGSLIGITFVYVDFHTTRCSNGMDKQLLVIPISAVAGLVGSLIDSLLGATLQYTGSVRNQIVRNPGPNVRNISGRNILDNNAVNFVSILLTTLLTGIACVYIF